MCAARSLGGIGGGGPGGGPGGSAWACSEVISGGDAWRRAEGDSTGSDRGNDDCTSEDPPLGGTESFSRLDSKDDDDAIGNVGVHDIVPDLSSEYFDNGSSTAPEETSFKFVVEGRYAVP